MPLGEGYYGTTADGHAARDYCRYCFQQGAFTQPELTLERMLQESIAHMTTTLKISPARAEELARDLIPRLQRWRRDV